MKAGTRVVVTFIRPEPGVYQELATVCRVVRKDMPLPPGYIRIRFDGDKAAGLVHVSYIKEM